MSVLNWVNSLLFGQNFIKNQDRFEVLNNGKGNYVSVNWKHHLFLQSEDGSISKYRLFLLYV